MVHWIPLAAWIAALVVALVVLGFCGYELNWKANRLRRDIRTLQADNAQLIIVQHRLAETQERMASLGLR